MSAKSATEMDDPLEPLPELPPEPLPLPATTGELTLISNIRAKTPATRAASANTGLPSHLRDILDRLLPQQSFGNVCQLPAFIARTMPCDLDTSNHRSPQFHTCCRNWCTDRTVTAYVQ